MIKIIAVGSVKNNHLKELINEYLCRILPYSKIEIIFLKDHNDPKNDSQGELERILMDEGNEIKNKINPKTDFIFSMCIEGELFDSVMFSQKIEEINIGGHKNIVFIIGGSHGLSKTIKEIAHVKLSFSPMTFPHNFFLVMLLEQIYRAITITKNIKYHK
ncbi:23S rRNA (pseudouridine(1915)-N(3))-methyltransferase RlmH [Ureaplasma canigenitalium]|uniref:23S rRNA (pseudouridine(1915)-N(3))-methyltransferase RlmH n=1 Tax=Ureaplasma canigenitalium TaxID=42092 RepID=UPI0004E166EB|nr:23S rRNA (pseudouridine(1915)-N(3))-methyltransferase RlmH [Ureaplasma canigenitalium]